MLFRSTPQNDKSGKMFALIRADNWFPLLAAVIFAAHPVNGEVVNWVSATPELLLAIFTLLSLIFYIKYLKNPKKVYLYLSCLTFFCALLSKETAVLVLPLALITLTLILTNLKRIKTNIRYLLIYLVSLGLYLFLRSAVLGRVVYKYEGYYAMSFADQILTGLALLPRYLLKLIWPLPLSFQPLIEPTKTFDSRVMLGLVAAVAVCGLIIWLWKRRLTLICFGLFLVLIGILPPLIFANKLGQFIFSERYLLFSTVGLAIVAVELTQILTNRKRILTKQLIWLGLGLYLVGSLIVVVRRDQDWKDNLASYRAMIRVDARNWNAHLGIARIYEASGEVDLAKEEFKQVLALDRQNGDAKSELVFLESAYSFGDVYSINYPMGFNLSRQNNKVLVTNGGVNIEITSDEKKVNQTYDQYLQAQKISGKLINQGLAQIPRVDFAYVRIFSEGSSQDFEFFLFKGGRVVRVVLSGAKLDKDMSDFNRILGSMRIK